MPNNTVAKTMPKYMNSSGLQIPDDVRAELHTLYGENLHVNHIVAWLFEQEMKHRDSAPKVIRHDCAICGSDSVLKIDKITFDETDVYGNPIVVEAKVRHCTSETCDNTWISQKESERIDLEVAKAKGRA